MLKREQRRTRFVFTKRIKPCVHPTQPDRSAFSLVELLAVIGIIGILLALSFPAAQAVRQAARRAHCLSNIRQVMTATLAYEGRGNGFPSGDNGKGGSYIVPLLSQMEEPRLHEEANHDLARGENYRDHWGHLGDESIAILLCPATDPAENRVELGSQGTYTTHYYGAAGPAGVSVDLNGETFHYRELEPTPTQGPIGLQGLFSPNSNGKFTSRRYKDILDGASNTIAFGEISGTPSRTNDTFLNRSGWAFGARYSSGKAIELYGCKTVTMGINERPTRINDVPFSSNHPTGAQFAFVDGSARFIDASVSVDVLKMLSSIDGRDTNASINGL